MSDPLLSKLADDSTTSSTQAGELEGAYEAVDEAVTTCTPVEEVEDPAAAEVSATLHSDCTPSTPSAPVTTEITDPAPCDVAREASEDSERDSVVAEVGEFPPSEESALPTSTPENPKTDGQLVTEPRASEFPSAEVKVRKFKIARRLWPLTAPKQVEKKHTRDHKKYSLEKRQKIDHIDSSYLPTMHFIY